MAQGEQFHDIVVILFIIYHTITLFNYKSMTAFSLKNPTNTVMEEYP